MFSIYFSYITGHSFHLMCEKVLGESCRILSGFRKDWKCDCEIKVFV